MRIAIALTLILFGQGANAQSICIAADPQPVDPCIAGIWEANTNMAARMQAILDSVPDSMRTRFEAQIDPMMGRNLMIAIFPDGYYVASPLDYGTIEGAFIFEEESTDFTLDMVVSPASGWLSSADNTISFCTDDGAGAARTSTSAVTSNGASFGVADSAFGPSPLGRNLPYSCAGGTMQMHMDLPDPIGRITYDLRKLPDARLDPSLRAAVDARFGG